MKKYQSICLAVMFIISASLMATTPVTGAGTTEKKPPVLEGQAINQTGQQEAKDGVTMGSADGKHVDSTLVGKEEADTRQQMKQAQSPAGELDTTARGAAENVDAAQKSGAAVEGVEMTGDTRQQMKASQSPAGVLDTTARGAAENSATGLAEENVAADDETDKNTKERMKEIQSPAGELDTTARGVAEEELKKKKAGSN